MTIKTRIQQLWAAREEGWEYLKAGVAAASAFSASMKKEEGGRGERNCCGQGHGCGHGHGCGSEGVGGLRKEVENLKEEVGVGMTGQSASIASTERALASAPVGMKEGLKELAEATRKRKRDDEEEEDEWVEEEEEDRQVGRAARALRRDGLQVYGALSSLVAKTGRRYHTKAAILEETGQRQATLSPNKIETPSTGARISDHIPRHWFWL
ncbi:hypothetical protein CF319_g7480 [Tilletia indica]|nr:hypothetical protein CF319_g7480 [Tilletia indica]